MKTEAQLAQILDEVLSVALERLNEGANGDDLVAQGEAMAYADVLNRAEEMAEVVGYDLQRLGLDGQRMNQRLAPAGINRRTRQGTPRR